MGSGRGRRDTPTDLGAREVELETEAEEGAQPQPRKCWKDAGNIF